MTAESQAISNVTASDEGDVELTQVAALRQRQSGPGQEMQNRHSLVVEENISHADAQLEERHVQNVENQVTPPLCKTKAVNIIRAKDEPSPGYVPFKAVTEAGDQQTTSTKGNPHTVYTLGMLSEDNSVWKIPVTISGTTVSCKVDTEAEVSVLLRSVYSRLHN